MSMSSRSGIVAAALVVVVLFATQSVMAQTYTARFVYIVLEGCDDDARETIRVVPDNDEARSFLATREGASNVWKAKAAVSFNAKNRIASLRVDGRRTACANSIPVPGPEGEGDWVAQYRFTCQFPAWRALTIDNDATAPISTVRFLPGKVPCKEKWLQRNAPSDVKSVAWRQEAIYVYFGDPGKLPYEYYDMVIRNGVFAGKAIQSELVIKREVVLKQQALRAGRGAGNAATIRDDFDLDPNVKTVTLKRVE